MTDPVVLTDAQIIHDFGTEIARLSEENQRLRRDVEELTSIIDNHRRPSTRTPDTLGGWKCEPVVTAARDVLDRFDRDTIQILKIEAGDGDTPEIDQLRRALDTPGTAETP